MKKNPVTKSGNWGKMLKKMSGNAIVGKVCKTELIITIGPV